MQCPICSNDLILKECAPCDDCGHLAEEIQHLKEGIHTYKRYSVYQDLSLQLCDFCEVDFGSYIPSYFGFKDNHRLKFEDFEFIAYIDNPQIRYDKYCHECDRKLNFLNFLFEIRLKNQIDDQL